MAEKKNEAQEFSWNDELREINKSLSGNGKDEEEFENSYDWVEDIKDINLDLEKRILEANEDKTKVKWSRLLPDLMGAEVLMVGQFTEQKDAAGNKILNILMLQKNGHAIIPFFTNPARIDVLAKSGRAQFDVMKVNTVRFFQSIKGTPTVLNPMSDYSRIFTPFEMKVLAAENIDKAPPEPADAADTADN